MRRVCGALVIFAFALGVDAQHNPSAPGLASGLRGPAPLTSEPTPPPFPKYVNDDQRKARNYPMQPPLIPHQIDNYQVDLRFHKCMDCHSRARVSESGAPMVSVTHFQDRDGNTLGEISARRYFCTGCHVVQTDAKLLVKNNFVDFHNIPADAPKTIPKKSAKK